MIVKRTIESSKGSFKKYLDHSYSITLPFQRGYVLPTGLKSYLSSAAAAAAKHKIENVVDRGLPHASSVMFQCSATRRSIMQWLYGMPSTHFSRPEVRANNYVLHRSHNRPCSSHPLARKPSSVPHPSDLPSSQQTTNASKSFGRNPADMSKTNHPNLSLTYRNHPTHRPHFPPR